MKQFAIIGLGRFGTSVATTLINMGYEVLGIDVNEERVNELGDKLTQAVKVDAIDEPVLKALGIRNFDVVVVAIGKNIQANILVSVMLKEMGVNKVVAKAQTDLHGKVLERVGVDKVVYPERDMGIKVAQALVSKNIMDQIALSPEHSLVEMAVPPDFINKSLEKSNARQKYGVSILAIRRGVEIIISPHPSQVMLEGDILVVIGKNEKLQKFETIDI
ncbi:potassium channel family protein [Desulforamulus aquiferis]|uniref:TrkA family potassium uptake protein n=1 Tax=Desulforamulus aquiferis TaxID=1397668 RepID=A0AAW7ZGR0_9FIRM|nr:TrkA family potassium uptake protein [Desulforamulus aquiferis]MDO7788467.1 TrkA family potassium uptake protein [Desulforamulus aquiferis]